MPRPLHNDDGDGDGGDDDGDGDGVRDGDGGAPPGSLAAGWTHIALPRPWFNPEAAEGFDQLTLPLWSDRVPRSKLS